MKDRNYKLVVIGIALLFVLILILSFRFLKGQLSQISTASDSIKNASVLDMDNWAKIKHRFNPTPNP